MIDKEKKKTLKLFNYSACSTCRKSIKWLKRNEIIYELIDILKDPPSKEILLSARNYYGDRQYLLNTSGIIYRSIGAKVIKNMDDKEFFDTLFKEPRLIKRPFLYCNDNCVLVGFKEEKWVEKLL